MLLAWLRGSSRAVALILLFASLWQLPHLAQDDEICAPAVETHDQSKHVFTSVQTVAHPDHCAICHWLRSVNPVFSAGPALPFPAEPGSGLTLAGPAALRDPAADRLPARAPPSHHI